MSLYKTNSKESTTIIPWNFTVYIVTWNVGTKYPENLFLPNLFGLNGKTQCPDHLPDIYAVGLQEVNSQPQNQVLGLFKEDPWTMKIKDFLREHDYVGVKTEQMQGLLLSLFSKREHVPHLKDIEAEFTRTGFGGIWGNKGAVSIRLSVYGCGISFVVAHLAAHDNELNERIEDYRQILEKHHYHVKKYREIFDHEYVFWFGDLNFRLNGDDSPEEVQDLVEQDKLLELVQRDQLLWARKTKKAFQQLEEKLPEFPPTFKFHEGTSRYDMKRRPAWTDRILYTVQHDKYPDIKLHLNQLSYKSHPSYNISDHKPVTSEFIIKIFKDPQETSIEFRHFPIWIIGEENLFEYSTPHGFEEKEHDWIGIYKSDYASFSEYAAYQYVNQGQMQQSNKFGEGPSIPRSLASSSSILRQSLQNVLKITRIEFSEDIELNDGISYILIYFQNTGLRGITSIAGISNVFRAEKRPPSPRFTAVD